jgi:hypothetical protein
VIFALPDIAYTLSHHLQIRTFGMRRFDFSKMRAAAAFMENTA